MVIGYVTVDEADQYVSKHFTSTDPARLAWESLDVEDKAVLLLNSFNTIESLVYVGRKAEPGQERAFPRQHETAVSQRVKDAQCANSVAAACADTRDDAEFYGKLHMFGIKGYSIGNLSETLSAESSTKFVAGLYSQETLRLLAPYIYGGYRIV